MKHIKLFERSFPLKFRFYDANGKWFSTGEGIESVSDHMERFGNDITFSLDGYQGIFNNIDDLKKHVNDVKSKVGYIFPQEDRESAKKRVTDKRNKRKKMGKFIGRWFW